MVVAKVSSAPEKFELKTCDGGWVTLRRMSYGEKLQRSELATKQTAQVEGRQMQGIDISLLSKQVARWEFANLIVDHNLEKEEGVPFEFGRPGDFEQLDPQVGEEINSQMDKMNNFEEEDQKGNS